MSILRLILFTGGVLLASVLLAQDSGPGNRLGGGSNRVAAIVRRLESLSPSSPRPPSQGMTTSQHSASCDESSRLSFACRA